MSASTALGSTVALFGIPAWRHPGNEEVPIPGGLYVIEDVVYPDRTCGQWDGGYLIFPQGGEDDELHYFVTGYDLLEQVNPKSHGRCLVWEREQEWSA